MCVRVSIEIPRAGLEYFFYREANNYATTLAQLQRFNEVKSLLRDLLPVTRRVLGESHLITFGIRCLYGVSLYKDTGATLDDLHAAVETLEDAGRAARRVLGGEHPLTVGSEVDLRFARATLRARETRRPHA